MMHKHSIVLLLMFIVSILFGCTPSNYTLIEADGTYYIQLSEKYTQNDSSENTVTSSAYLSPVNFASLAEMKADIKVGNFSEEELKTISGFPKTDSSQITICNINKLYEPVCPAGWSPTGINWYGKGYVFTLSSDQNCYGYTQTTTNDDFDEASYNMYHHEDLPANRTLDAKVVSDDNLTVTYDYTTFQGLKVQIVYRKIIAGSKEMIVEESYGLDESGNHSINMHIYGKENGLYFFFSLNDLSAPFTIDELSQFSFREYVETVTE